MWQVNVLGKNAVVDEYWVQDSQATGLYRCEMYYVIATEHSRELSKNKRVCGTTPCTYKVYDLLPIYMKLRM